MNGISAFFKKIVTWVGSDGLLHFAMSAIIVFALGWVNPLWAVPVVALLIGVIKEGYDWTRAMCASGVYNWKHSGHDLICDLVGVVFGLLLVWVNLAGR